MAIEPLPLESGHWQTVINEFYDYIRDLKNLVFERVLEKDFKNASSLAKEIADIEAWIDTYKCRQTEDLK